LSIFETRWNIEASTALSRSALALLALWRLSFIMTKIGYTGYRFPPAIIQQAIWLYARFTLSFRDVEDLLAERRIAADLHRRRPKPHTTWHLDEVYLKIDGRLVYLWRAVDSEGEVLDVLVQTKRNKAAALKLMRKLLKKYGFLPETLVTDDLRSYHAAAREAWSRSWVLLVNSAWCPQSPCPYFNSLGPMSPSLIGSKITYTWRM
jgi:transposase-like protein